jgi:uncharacterized repeat protein (TIGR01451 family)
VFGKLLYHNFILVYRFGNWIRRRFTPTGILILSALIASATFGLDTRQTLAYQIFALCVSLLLVAFVSIIFLRGRLELKRSLPDFGTVGQEFEYTLSVHNNGKAAQQDMVLFDELDTAYPGYLEFKNTRDTNDRYRNIFDRWIGYPRLLSSINRKRGAGIPPVEINTLAAGETLEKKIGIRPLRRGYLYFNQTKIAKSDPLGLFRSISNQAHRDRLLILPKRYKLPSPSLPGRRKYQHGGMSLASSVGDSQEFFALRDYRPGDPLRAIHWRSYAKKGEPVVKEQQDEYFARYGLVLDTFLENRPEFMLEDAVSVAASLAVAVRDQESLLDLMFIGDRAWRFTSGRGLAGTENMLEILACVASCTTSPFSALEHLVLRQAGASSGFICIFLDWDGQRRQLVRRLRALHMPVVVIVIHQTGKNETGDDDPMQDQPQFFWVLEMGDIQQSLDRLPRHT